MSRSIDMPQNDLGVDTVQTSATFPPSTDDGDGVCANFADGDAEAYLIHVGEGVDATALAEFAKLDTLTTVDGCLLAPETTITHGVAFTASEFATMAERGMKLTWSPASNVALYGDTADIPAALDAGVTVALAPDWSMGGSQNLLDELRFADDWDDTHFGDRLAADDLVAMVTTHAAQVVGYDDQLGSITEGFLADLVVVSGSRVDPFQAIVDARPADVRLVMVGGQILYGDAVFAAAAPAGCESLDVCGTPKFLCVAESSTHDKLDETYTEIKATLDVAMSEIDADAGLPYDFAPLTPLVRCE